MDFFIIKKAIYLHGVYGPYKTIRKAEKAFQSAYDNAKAAPGSCWMGDFDGHHEYRIVCGLEDFKGQRSNGGKLVKVISYKPIREAA